MTFTKHDQAKARFDLLPPKALWEMVNVFTYGGVKYTENNWRKCQEPNRFVGAAMRHLIAWRMGEKKDYESQLHSLAHAAASCLMALGLELQDSDPSYLKLQSQVAVMNGRAAKAKAGG